LEGKSLFERNVYENEENYGIINIMIREGLYLFMRKHIGFVLCDLSAAGGAEKAFSVIANQLIEYYDITAISYIYAEKSFYKLNSKINIKSIFTKGGGYRLRHLILPRFVMKLRRALRDLDVVIFVSSASSLGIISTICSKNKRIITWEHTSLVNRMYQTKKRMFLQYIAAKYSDALVQLTEANTQIAKERFRYRDLDIVTIYNSLNDELLNTKMSCNIEARNIVTFARIEKVKGLDLLIEVAKIVLKKNRDWRWHVYGQCCDEEYALELENKRLKSDVGNQLAFYKPVKNIETVLCNSSIFVLTSYYEGLPMSMLEAKAYGLPIVSFDCPTGPSEIISNGQNGDLIPCYDIKAMAQKINELICSMEKRKYYKYNSKVGWEKFSLVNVIKQWRDLIECN